MKWNVWNKKTWRYIFSNPTLFVHIWNLLNIVINIIDTVKLTLTFEDITKNEQKYHKYTSWWHPMMMKFWFSETMTH